MRIDAIIQSTAYADLLAITLPLNKASFDSVIVYTKTGDEKTKAVCVREEVECIETDLFTKSGSRFNRGAVFNASFLHLLRKYQSAVGWFCILDSDIVLPQNWRQIFEALPSDIEYLYGARRYNVETQEQFSAIRSNTLDMKTLTLFRGYGYSYLQLFTPLSSTFVRIWNATKGNPYLEWHDGSTADWVFRNFWGFHNWDPPTLPPDHVLDHSIPEPCDPPQGLLRKLPFNVVHLGITGINSTGRNTPLWK